MNDYELRSLSILKHISTYALAVLLIVATMGISVQHHFCRGVLSETSVFAKASCEMAKSSCDLDSDGHKHHKGTKASNENCCDTTSEFLQLEEEFQVETFSPLNLFAFTPLVFPEFKIKPFSQEFTSTYRNDDPPPLLIPSDRYAWTQVFLI